MKRFFTFIFLLTSLLSAQPELKTHLAYASLLYNQEKYFDAVTEAKRVEFFDSTKQFAFETNFLIAQSYKRGNKLSDAAVYFTKAEINARNQQEFLQSKIEQIKVNILRRAFTQVNNQLDKLESDSRFSGDSSAFKYWRGWNYLFNDEWEKASELFGENDSTAQLKILCEQVQKKKYSVSFAKGLSVVLPGAGQFYTGNYFSGILSLGWNVLWGYVTVKAFNAERTFDGMAIGSLLWLRFYNGNLTNAEKFAKERNEQASDEALQFLQKNYQGPKP